MNHRQIASYLCIMPPLTTGSRRQTALRQDFPPMKAGPLPRPDRLTLDWCNPTSPRRNLDIRLTDDFERTRLPGAPRVSAHAL